MLECLPSSLMSAFRRIQMSVDSAAQKACVDCRCPWWIVFSERNESIAQVYALSRSPFRAVPESLLASSPQSVSLGASRRGISTVSRASTCQARFPLEPQSIDLDTKVL